MITRKKFVSHSLKTIGALSFLSADCLANLQTAMSNLKYSEDIDQFTQDELAWAIIQRSFNVDRSIINLNNGGLSPSPIEVMDAFKNDLDYSNEIPALNMWKKLEPKVEAVREQLALNFGCDSEEIAITRNASEALENVQFGLDLQSGDEVITTDNDYPRMLTTWDQIARRNGIIVHKIKLDLPVNEDQLIDDIKAKITKRTKVIHISHVLFSTGQILPVNKISRLAHEHGVEVICDGAHSFSHFPFKLADLECDYFATSLHKWTYAPVGSGFLYVPKNKIKKIWPLMAAPKKLDDDIRKFEEIGTHPAANHNAVLHALKFNEKLGIDNKAERLRYLNKLWIDRIKKFNNVRFVTDINDQEKFCGIVSFYIDGINPGKLRNYLFEKHKIYCINVKAGGTDAVRITPNIYTNKEEIEKFVDLIEIISKNKIKELLK